MSEHLGADSNDFKTINCCNVNSVDAICELSLFLVLFFAPRGFSSGYSGFPLSSKINISKFQFDQESGRRRTTLWMCYLQIIIIMIIIIR